MVEEPPYPELVVPEGGKIVFLVVDGLGGLPREAAGGTELETACTPNLDRLASRSLLGLAEIAGPGITPGSGAGHLALFGYDPLRYRIGRGILSALGVGMDIRPGDVFARGNFATVDDDGVITDRRAGRIPTELCAELCGALQKAAGRIGDVEIGLVPERDYRFVVRFRGPGLGDAVSDTDPQREGLRPLLPQGRDEASRKTARAAGELQERAAEVLRGRRPANAILLRGFAGPPGLPPLRDRTGLRAAAAATYPMYRGLARLLGMQVLETGLEERFESLAAAVRGAWEGFDFFFVHVKKADSCGEDGDFEGKVRVIEAVDRELVPRLLEPGPEVFVVTGDHSSPAVMRGHSWHPVPFLLHSPWVRPSGAERFGETCCARGALGTFPAVQAMGHVLAHARRLAKFGA